MDELLFDELLLDPSDELPEVPDPVEPELDVEPVDELELDEDLLPVLVVAAWLDAGSTTATTPARATLATDYGRGRRVQPASALLALFDGARDLPRRLAVGGPRSLFLPVIHVNQCHTPG